MTTFLVVLHVFVSIFLIAVVLLQRGKGAEIGAVFGGGASSTVFGSRGAGNFLTKLTTASAVIFMTTSLSLSYIWTSQSTERLFDDDPAALEAVTPDEETPLFEEVPGAVPDPGAETPAPSEEAALFEEVPSAPPASDPAAEDAPPAEAPTP
jgi:preprotein translocase subunit SecG